jgi:hypothetical protein
MGSRKASSGVSIRLEEWPSNSEPEANTNSVLQFDPAKEHFIDDAEADRHLTRQYRTPYVLPDVV